MRGEPDASPIVAFLVFFCSFVFLLNVGLAAANVAGTLSFLESFLEWFITELVDLYRGLTG